MVNPKSNRLKVRKRTAVTKTTMQTPMQRRHQPTRRRQTGRLQQRRKLQNKRRRSLLLAQQRKAMEKGPKVAKAVNLEKGRMARPTN